VRKEEHLIFASVVGYLMVEILSLLNVSVIDSHFTRITCIVLAMIGALIPDKIERPKIGHRKFFHSKLFLFCLVLFVYAFRNSVLFVALLCGYISHLLLDWTTRRKLPLY
jgi:membrane-bound metal-dependent hydrolase YbcI (DUF457 family)